MRERTYGIAGIGRGFLHSTAHCNLKGRNVSNCRLPSTQKRAGLLEDSEEDGGDTGGLKYQQVALDCRGREGLRGWRRAKSAAVNTRPVCGLI